MTPTTSTPTTASVTTTAPARRGLRDFYEDPSVPVASGTPRSLRQARILAAALGPATASADRAG
ncbi:SAM-dependent methyltransferase, partial [Streptomyces mirabilis]